MKIFPLLSFFIPFFSFLITLNPTAGWIDSPEFIASAHTLSIPHPPSHPLYLILAKGFSFLPFTNIAIRINILSALFGALSSLLLFRISLIILSREKFNPSSLALLSSLFFSLSYPLWIQSIRAEVYSLNLFLCLLCTELILKGGFKNITSLFFIGGLAFANHNYLTFLFLISVMIGFLLKKETRDFLFSKNFFLFALFFILGLLPYLYLPLRALSDPFIQWGDPLTLKGFFEIVSARIFHTSISQDFSFFKNLVEKGIFMIMDHYTPVFLILSLGGIYLLFRKNKWTGFFLLLLLSTNLFSKLSMSIVDPQNPDDYGYFLLSYAVLSIFFIIPLDFLLDEIRKLKQYLSYSIAIFLVILFSFFMIFHSSKKERNYSDFYDPEIIGEKIFSSLPADTILFLSHYPVYFISLYKYLVENERPDISLIHESLYYKVDRGDFYVKKITRNYPVLKNFIKEYKKNYKFPFGELLKLIQRYPVYIELMHDLKLPQGNLIYDGILYRVCEIQEKPRTDEIFRKEINLKNSLKNELKGGGLWSTETRRVLLLKYVMNYHYFKSVGLYNNACFEIKSAEELNPYDTDVQRLKKEIKDCI